MTAEFAYALVSGTVSKATLLGTASNFLQSFPLQSDQYTPALRWIEPVRDATSRPTPPRRTVMADLSQRDDGFYGWQWSFPFWTFGQMAYWLTTFHGAPDIYTNPTSAAVTVQTFAENSYLAFNALMYRPKWKDDFSAQDGGYQNVLIKFAGGVIIT